MLTLFSIPEAFSGPIGTLQANAIGSWIWLDANCEDICLTTILAWLWPPRCLEHGMNYSRRAFRPSLPCAPWMRHSRRVSDLFLRSIDQ